MMEDGGAVVAMLMIMMTSEKVHDYRTDGRIVNFMRRDGIIMVLVKWLLDGGSSNMG